MATPVAALEDCSFLSMTAGGAPVVAHKASPERLRELDNILSRALPRFRRIAMRDPRPTPEQTVEQRQFRQIITKLTNGLPPHQRAALLLRQQDCFSLKETALILGVPVGTVKAQLARGRAKLIERFHKLTRTPKIEAAGSGPKTRRKASSSGRRRNRAQDTAYVPMPAVLSQQGGCEVWVSA